MTANLAGASVWEQDLYEHLESHLEQERGLLEEYEQLAKEAPAWLAYVLRMILDDEHRHHQMFTDLAQTVEVQARFLADPPAVPTLESRTDQEQVVAVTERLLALEKRDAKELDRLARDLRDVRDTTLWGLIVEVMRRDTDKHIAMLTFVRAHGGRRH